MLVRDSGVIQLFVEDAQEAYDTMLLAVRLSERMLLPVFVCQDGFTITHAAEPVRTIGRKRVQEWVGDYEIPFALLDTARPTSQGPFAMPDYYFELRHQQVAAMHSALGAIEELGAELAEVTGRHYGLVDAYRLDDADCAIVCLGSTAGTVKDAVDELRDHDKAVGVLRIRSFRPFPEDAIRSALAGVAEVIALDRADAPGARGPLYTELAAALYGSDIVLRDHVYGLGGRELHPHDVYDIFTGRYDRFVGLRSESCLV
jgi:pyruvate ferredoxin oxidoreductase alpha subunit